MGFISWVSAWPRRPPEEGWELRFRGSDGGGGSSRRHSFAHGWQVGCSLRMGRRSEIRYRLVTSM